MESYTARECIFDAAGVLVLATIIYLVSGANTGIIDGILSAVPLVIGILVAPQFDEILAHVTRKLPHLPDISNYHESVTDAIVFTIGFAHLGILSIYSGFGGREADILLMYLLVAGLYAITHLPDLYDHLTD